MIYGYARVSTADQNLDRQTDALKNYKVDKIFCEKISGTKKNRPELDKLLSEISSGDTIVIESLSRLGRSVKNLAELFFENQVKPDACCSAVTLTKRVCNIHFNIFLCDFIKG